jgi:hypothetical protein
VSISQTRVLRTCNSHMGGVNHHACLVGKYVIGDRG